ncbi:MAG: hypothetical protein CMO77_00865 [Verrucomicrobiales bacterium]|nr:hypothetical protein [Verrucomicrobiales bacterium]
MGIMDDFIFLGQMIIKWEPVNPDEWLNYTYCEIGYSVYEIILTIVFIFVIKRIYENQKLNLLEQY